MKKTAIKAIGWTTLVLVLATAAFFWNEAREEIVFLCGNFTQGVSEQSVRSQLDTGHYLSYHTEDTAFGQRIVAESSFNLFMPKCIIDVDSTGVVRSSRIK